MIKSDVRSYNTFAKKGDEEIGFSSKVKSSQNNFDKKTHDRNSSTNSQFCPASFENSLAPSAPDYFSDAVHPRTNNHAGTVALDRERRQSSNLTALVSYAVGLGLPVMDGDSG